MANRSSFHLSGDVQEADAIAPATVAANQIRFTDFLVLAGLPDLKQGGGETRRLCVPIGFAIVVETSP
jgi:hypothetical protein